MCTLSGSRPKRTSAGARMMARKMYAAVTVMPMPSTKLVSAPMTSSTSGWPPAR